MDGVGEAAGDSAGLGQDELFAMDESFLSELMDLEAFSSLYDSPSLLSGGSGSTDLGCVRVPTNHFPPNGDLHPPVELLPTTTTERIWQALKLYVRIAKGEVLAQVWVPVRQGGRFVLATDAQPFIATEMDRLLHFRRHSATFRFSAEDGGDGDGSCLGLPGRVFRTRKPEWTPNVQLYRVHEYLRRNLAIDCNVRGTICLPVFNNHLGNSCIAVIELAMLSERIAYNDDINSICQALQAVNLFSSDTHCQSPMQAVNLCSSETHCQLPMQVKSDMRQAVLMELTEVLKIVSKTHKLPLAQTWLPYHINEWQKEKGAKAGEVYLCTKGMPFYMDDMSVEGFRQACTEHYLGKGQGVAGKAYTCNEPVFSSDVKSYGKLEYPLCHYAEMFFLTAAVAIRLRSVLTGNDDYILEFFLPRACIGFPSQQCLLNALSASMQHVCVSLRTVTNKELEEEEERQGSCPPEKMAVVRPEVCDFPLSGAHHLVQESKRLRHERGRGGTVEKAIGLSILQQYFAGSLKDAAKSIGVCPTTLKRICRQHGIPRWPSRKIKKVSRTLKKLQVVINSVQGASDGAVRINALASDLASMGAIAPPSSQEGLTKSLGGVIPQKLVNDNNEEGSDTSKKVNMRNLSNGDRKVEEEEVSLEELIHSTSLENESEGSPSTSSERSSRQSEQESSWTMVEAVCGNSTARFKLHLKAGYRELMEEVGKIFKLHVDSFDLKYFDDDEEWVMLTCESDLSECIDVLKSSAQNHIKLSVRQRLTKPNHIG